MFAPENLLMYSDHEMQATVISRYYMQTCKETCINII